VYQTAERPRTPELLVAEQEQLPLGATKKSHRFFSAFRTFDWTSAANGACMVSS